jgi:hypothetical protein
MPRFRVTGGIHSARPGLQVSLQPFRLVPCGGATIGRDGNECQPTKGRNPKDFPTNKTLARPQGRGRVVWFLTFYYSPRVPNVLLLDFGSIKR